ncbi:MAG: hypothetical protein AAGG38_08570 [Planctomycetota bacterium]
MSADLKPGRLRPICSTRLRSIHPDSVSAPHGGPETSAESTRILCLVYAAWRDHQGPEAERYTRTQLITYARQAHTAQRVGDTEPAILTHAIAKLDPLPRALIWLWAVADYPTGHIAYIINTARDEATELIAGTLELLLDRCQAAVANRSETHGRAGWAAPLHSGAVPSSAE